MRGRRGLGGLVSAAFYWGIAGVVGLFALNGFVIWGELVWLGQDDLTTVPIVFIVPLAVATVSIWNSIRSTNPIAYESSVAPGRVFVKVPLRNAPPRAWRSWSRLTGALARASGTIFDVGFFLALALMICAAVVVWGKDGLLVSAAIGLTLLLAFRSVRHASIELGSDGIRLRAWGVDRRIAFSRMDVVRVRSDGLMTVLGNDLEPVVLPLHHDVPIAPGSITTWLELLHDWGLSGRTAPGPIGLEGRGARAFGEWIEAAGKRETAYRAVGDREEALVQAVGSAMVDADIRLAAAIALSRRGGEARDRARWLAATSMDPSLRTALLRALDGTIDERTYRDATR